jgi:tetratricopeptide (TPR) repeat protein
VVDNYYLEVKMVHCPYCGHDSPDFAIYCQECGKQITINDSESASDLNTKGREFQKEENYETALKYFKKAINLDPSYAPPYCNIGAIYFILGEYENALRFLNKFKELATIPDLKSFVKNADNLIDCINQGIILTGWDEERERDAILTLKEGGVGLQWKSFLGRDIGTQETKYSDITSIAFKKGILIGTLEIIFPGGKIKIGKVHKDLGNLFVSNVRKKIQNYAKTPKMEALSPIDEIKKAKELVDSGVITQDQFEKIRDKYLKKLS